MNRLGKLGLRALRQSLALISWGIFAGYFMGCVGPLSDVTPTPPTTDAVMCTQVGCQDGLMIEVEPQVPEPLNVQVKVPGEENWIFQCPSTHPRVECGENSLFMADFTPEEVTLVLTWDGGWITRTLQPTYTILEPNGLRCPPKCRRALYHLALSMH